jgi:hypothetical protein
MCAAYDQVGEIDLKSASRTHIATGLVALASVPDWLPGDKVRDGLIDWFNQMSDAIDLSENDSIDGIDAQIAALDALGVVSDGLQALQVAMGEPIPCRNKPASSTR